MKELAGCVASQKHFMKLRVYFKSKKNSFLISIKNISISNSEKQIGTALIAYLPNWLEYKHSCTVYKQFHSVEKKKKNTYI